MQKTQETYALITGASKGLGKAIAIQLAKKGYNLLLVARSCDELAKLASEIQIANKVKVEYLAIDLAESSAVSTIVNWITGHGFALSILINNAGYGLWGDFASLDLAAQLDMCRLNMDTVIGLCHKLIPLLAKNEEAYVLNICSTAAYQSVPTLAVYSATKAFILSFTRAIRFELKKGPVSVSCLSPGPIDTGFAHRAGLDAFNKMAEKFNMSPEEVAQIAIKGMFAKSAEIIPGITNWISIYANKILPKAFIEKMAAGIYKT